MIAKYCDIIWQIRQVSVYLEKLKCCQTQTIYVQAYHKNKVQLKLYRYTRIPLP